jgi:hypothetical protein
MWKTKLTFSHETLILQSPNLEALFSLTYSVPDMTYTLDYF